MLTMNVAIRVAGKMVPIPNPGTAPRARGDGQGEADVRPRRPQAQRAQSPLTKKFDLRSVSVHLGGGAAPHRRGRTLRADHRRGEARRGLPGSPSARPSPTRIDAPRTGAIGVPMPDAGLQDRRPRGPGPRLPAGERGELCIRGPQVMLGYWNRPEETALAVGTGGSTRATSRSWIPTASSGSSTG